MITPSFTARLQSFGDVQREHRLGCGELDIIWDDSRSGVNHSCQQLKCFEQVCS